MRTPQFFFFRGSTPTLELALPFALGEADAAVLTLAQDGQIVLEYARGADGEGLSVPADEPDLLRIRLPQADTLRLTAGDCELQLRIRNADGAVTFYPIFGQIGQARKEEVI